MDIKNIMSCFRVLSELGVREITLPCSKFFFLAETVKRNSDDGGSFQQKDTLGDTNSFSIYGVRVLSDDIS